jgi:hypothetical protein
LAYIHGLPAGTAYIHGLPAGAAYIHGRLRFAAFACAVLVAAQKLAATLVPAGCCARAACPAPGGAAAVAPKLTRTRAGTAILRAIWPRAAPRNGARRALAAIPPFHVITLRNDLRVCIEKLSS